jgi:hypothetical protein
VRLAFTVIPRWRVGLVSVVFGVQVSEARDNAMTSVSCADDEGRSRRGWRYSLRTAIVATAFTLIGISHFNTTLELRSARRTIALETKELAELRDELGVFEILDPSRAHVLSIRTLEPNAFRFRVYLPPRQKDYEVCCAVEGIPATDVPSDMYEFQQLHGLSSDVLVPKVGGTFSVDVFLRKDEQGQLRLYTRHPQGTLQPAIDADHLLAQATSSPQVWQIEPSEPPRLQVLDPRQPVVLLRWRTCPENDVAADGSWPEGTHDGVIVWIR